MHRCQLWGDLLPFVPPSRLDQEPRGCNANSVEARVKPGATAMSQRPLPIPSTPTDTITP